MSRVNQEFLSIGQVPDDTLYSTKQARLATVAGIDNQPVWQAIMNSRSQYIQTNGLASTSGSMSSPHQYGFRQWLEDDHGIRLVMDNDDIGLEYQIVDEGKYTMFLLKYW